MKLTLTRIPGPRNWGRLAIDGAFYCDTLEDADRRMEVGGIKIPGQTAIPLGTYRVVIDWSPKFGRNMLHLLDVPRFAGIRVHGIVDEDDTEGCIGVGVRQHEVLLHGSAASGTLRGLVSAAIDRGEECWITITRAEPDGGDHAG